MDKMSIQGGRALQGEVLVSGAKNSALPLLFSSLLSPGKNVFTNVPKLMDVDSACLLLRSLGCKTHQEQDRVEIDVPEVTEVTAHYDLVRKMRASILVLGPLLARQRKAVVSLPGGCAIGTRPIDLHLEALQSLGVRSEVQSGYVHSQAEQLQGANFVFETATVGGTENLLMASCLASGVTVIENAAKEPEIVDLVECLRSRGAKIEGEGTGVLKIHGVKELKPAQHRVIPDRIEAGTLLMAGLITEGEVKVKGLNPSHLESVIWKLREAGFGFEVGPDWILTRGNRSWKGVDITTQPHPFFPTDLQAQFMAMMTVAQGTSIITESVFENRFMHVQELMRLGADITSRSRVAIVRGKPRGLVGAPVMATDLRASASLILAGLAARGETLVSRIYHLDRGYEALEKKLSLLGASIQRVSSSAVATI